MYKPRKVKALSDYKLWIRYSDGVEGEVDLSNLVGNGVFALWNDYDAFKKVRIGEHGELVWSDQVDLCPDSMYMKSPARA